MSDDNQNVDIFKAAEDSLVHELVGEGKKFKDVEALARGKKESDQYIQSLKEKNEELQALAENLKSRLESATRVRDTSESQSRTEVMEPDPARLRDVIKGLFQEQTEEQTRTSNLRKFENEVVKEFGEKAAEILNETALTIGMSVDQLKVMAATTPEAAKRLIGIGGSKTTAKSNATPKGESSERTAKRSDGTGKSFDEWQEIRRKNPSLFYSPDGQMSYLRDMEKAKLKM